MLDRRAALWRRYRQKHYFLSVGRIRVDQRLEKLGAQFRFWGGG
jgi:hypothetical protein